MRKTLFLITVLLLTLGPQQAYCGFFSPVKNTLKKLVNFYNAIIISNPERIRIFSPEQKVLQEILNKKNPDYSFAMIRNKAQKRDRETNKIAFDTLKIFVNIVKDILNKELQYREQKRKTYSIYKPKSYGKGNNFYKLENIYDFDQVVKIIAPNLIFTQEQKRVITNILMQMQRNSKKAKLNPKKIKQYNTQLFLAGPPGTAKTQLAYLCAEITGLPVIVLSVSPLTLLKNHGVRALTELVKEAEMKNCLLFMDETELLFMNRKEISQQGIASKRKRASKSDLEFGIIIHNLLTVFLALTGSKPLSIIAATNKPDIIDPAIRRRFEHILEMKLPELPIRKKIFLRYFKFYGVRFSDATLEEAAEIGALHSGASHGEKDDNILGFSGSEIQSICIRLTEINPASPQINGTMISLSNTNELVSTIQDRIRTHLIFGANISMSSAGSIVDEEPIDSFVNEENIRAKRMREKIEKESAIMRFRYIKKIKRSTSPCQAVYIRQFDNRQLKKQKMKEENGDDLFRNPMLMAMSIFPNQKLFKNNTLLYYKTNRPKKQKDLLSQIINLGESKEDVSSAKHLKSVDITVKNKPTSGQTKLLISSILNNASTISKSNEKKMMGASYSQGNMKVQNRHKKITLKSIKKYSTNILDA